MNITCFSDSSLNLNITSDNSQDNVTDLENNSINLVKESERNLTILVDFVPYEQRLSIGPCDIYDQVKKICSEQWNILGDLNFFNGAVHYLNLTLILGLFKYDF